MRVRPEEVRQTLAVERHSPERPHNRSLVALGDRLGTRRLPEEGIPLVLQLVGIPGHLKGGTRVHRLGDSRDLLEEGSWGRG